MTLEVIAWPTFFSSCFCRSAFSSARQSASSDPRPGFVRGFSFSLSRTPERARTAAEPSGRPDISPALSPPVLRRFRASWTRPARERDTAADLCTAYNARTGSTTRFAVRPIKYHPRTRFARSTAVLAPCATPCGVSLYTPCNRGSRKGSPVGQGKGAARIGPFSASIPGCFFIRFLGGLPADSRSGS